MGSRLLERYQPRLPCSWWGGLAPDPRCVERRARVFNRGRRAGTLKEKNDPPPLSRPSPSRPGAGGYIGGGGRMRRTALVTGASHRVGRAIALELARTGFDVAVHYRSSREGAAEVVEGCRALGAQAFAVQGDLEHPDQTLGLAAQVAERFERLTLLVNNASIFIPRSFQGTSLDELRRNMAVHVEAPFLLSQALLPHLQAAAQADPELESSLVCHLCDIAAERPFKGYTAYSASKAALVMLVKSMAIELAPLVRTVGVAPGHVAWPPDYDDATKARMLRRIPQGRVGTPVEAARLVRFLCLEGTYINGDVVRIDGGLSRRY
ncbi:MAG: SDR family oxidoreductase [Deltaproteobacteria bacterium]|nr:MAG: SDR family oxidoreductase [Deltaproteobacteria bacterium]